MPRKSRNTDYEEIYSWVYYPPETAVKRLDRSAFLHHGSGVPKELRHFFGAEKMAIGSKRQLTLRHINKNYRAYIELRETIGVRSRLFWFADFSGLIHNRYAEFYQEYASGAAVQSEPPLMRLQRLNTEKSVFSVEFVLPQEIRRDVESELETEQPLRAEGAVRYLYSKQFERDPVNRRRAIEIHGARCCICMFDFERHYGRRGMGFIEIHHMKPLSSVSTRLVVDPRIDLVPVCSNCHRMIHRRKDEVLTVAQMQQIWRQAHVE